MNESKSQQYAPFVEFGTVVTNIRISMNESKSQLKLFPMIDIRSCYKYQNINERKQITTATIHRS